MTHEQFERSVILEIRAMMKRNVVPESFEAWLGSDSIDIGGNQMPDRVQSNHDQYDNERHPFQ